MISNDISKKEQNIVKTIFDDLLVLNRRNVISIKRIQKIVYKKLYFLRVVIFLISELYTSIVNYMLFKIKTSDNNDNNSNLIAFHL